jgi:putative colanic acid biosynthesis UDP-glucose lipid carrier transferase
MFIPSESNTDQKLKDKILKEAELNKVKVSLVPNISLSNYFQYDFGI